MTPFKPGVWVRFRAKRPSWSTAPDLPWRTAEVVEADQGTGLCVRECGGIDWICSADYDIELTKAKPQGDDFLWAYHNDMTVQFGLHAGVSLEVIIGKLAREKHELIAKLTDRQWRGTPLGPIIQDPTEP